MRWTITSVSVEAVKIEPCASRSARSASALTRFPLWATATAPPGVLHRQGLRVLHVRGAGGGVPDVTDGGARP